MKDQTKKIIEKLNLGLTPVEVSKELNIPKYSVYRVIKIYKVAFKSERDRIKERDNKVCELFLNSDLLLQEIAERFKCTKSNICLILKKNNLSVPTERKNNNRKKTIQKKYGVDNVMHVKDIIEKREEYFLDKFGAKTPFGNKEILQKAKNTLIKKYGVDNPLKSKDIQKKVKKTNLEKYGGVAPACSKQVRNKMEKTNFKRYGISNYKQKNYSQEVKDLIQNKEKFRRYLIKWHHEKETTLEEISIKLGMTRGTLYNYMKALKVETKRFYKSLFEKKVAEYIKSIYNGEIITNDRSYKFELDLLMPESNLAIECNGLFWHSYDIIPTLRNKNYHKN